jgi:methionine-rich copper-binding protein CopC
MVKRLSVLVYLLVMLLVASFLVACGGTPSNTPQPNANDKTPPTLTASIPASGSSAVPINAKLGFTFSEAMDEASLKLTSTPSITLGNPTWNENSTSVAFDNTALAASTPYTLTLKAKDVSGNALAEAILTFTTSDTSDTTAPSTPTGLVATPADGQVALTWQANSDADVAGYTLYMGTAQDKLEPQDFTTTNSKTITGLTNSTTYFFAVDAVDTANNHSSQSQIVSATPSTSVTDTTAPKIQSSNPADGAKNVNPRGFSLKLVFSEPMDTTTFAFTATPPQPFPALGLEPAAATDFTVVWSEGDTVATLKPSEALLLENTLFTFTLNNAKDKAGNALSGDKEITFTTGEEAPVLVSSTPANGATDVGVVPFEIKLGFSKPMDPATLKVEPTLEPLDIPFYSQSWTQTWSENDTVLTLTTTINPGYFLEDTTYTLLLTGKSKAGIALATTTLSFTTVDDATRPKIVSTSPAKDMTDVSLSPLDVFIYFDDVMDVPSTLAALSSSPALPCEWQQFFDYKANDTRLTSAFACRSETKTFEPNTVYTITVSTTAKDSSGNNLDIGTCIGAPGDPPCAYTFKFTTLTPPPPTGTLRLEISGLPLGQKKVRVTGPNFDSGLLDEGTTFSNAPIGDYTVAASAFTVAPGKPACRIYTPDREFQFLIPVNPNQTTTATVTYESESCAAPPGNP